MRRFSVTGRRLPLLFLGALLAGATQLHAQQAAPPDTVALRAARATLRSDLRNFLVAQERYFADHTTYARSLGEMATIYVPSRGVTIVLLTSSNTGHSEIAIIDRMPGLVCAIFVGNSASPLGTGGEGEPVCRDP
jgi:hypothetical protein